MKNSFKILGIAGSLRLQSYNRYLLQAAKELAPEGVEFSTFDLDAVPSFNQDHENNPHNSVVELKSAIQNADAVLFVTPEYNYSIPGVLKNAIDWASRPHGTSVWGGKPVAIMGATMGTLGTSRAQYHLRQVCVGLDMYVLNKPEVMVSNASKVFDAQGNLIDESTKKHVAGLLNALVDWALLVSKRQ